MVPDRVVAQRKVASLLEYISENESSLWLVDAESGAKQPIAGRGGEKSFYGCGSGVMGNNHP